MKIETKHGVGDEVWYIFTPSRKPVKCEKCDSIIGYDSSGTLELRQTIIKEISISVCDNHGLSDEAVCFILDPPNDCYNYIKEAELFATKEEAEAEIKRRGRKK